MIAKDERRRTAHF